MTSPETLELEAVDAALAGRYVAPEHAELAELALLLRDDRPEPTPAWRSRLDRRVEAGFPARPKQRRRLRVWLGHAAPVVAVFAAIAVIAVPIALVGGGDDDGGGGSSSAGLSLDSGGGGTAGGASEAAPAVRDSKSAPSAPKADRADRRKVERAVVMTLAAPRRQIDEVATEIGDVTADVGGFVRRSRVSSNHGGDLQLRVPTNRLDTAIQRLSKLAKVRDLSRSSEDITRAVVSARDRLRDAKAERKALLEQLASATTVNETESIRARLDIVARQIAAARNALSRVNNRADFADVSVSLVTTSGAEDGEGGAWTPGDAWHDALRLLEVIAGVLVIAAAIAVPLLVAWLLGWLGRRGYTRRRRERALDMA
ncbi:MAG TPA: DUF4349 domain-containing protein [Solirubrobacteraceae bacterium]|jgi:hypothetical protein|nr:DUF4349 domain-containing protein [Solirubrobacteraceae bacterium]